RHHNSITIKGSTTQPYIVEIQNEDQLEKIQTIEPGYVGFRVVRKLAEPTPGVTDPDLESLFQLLSYQTDDNHKFASIGTTLPLGPVTNPNDPDSADDDEWIYERVIPAARLAKDKNVPYTLLPVERNPYAGLDGQITVDFELLDVYGNHTMGDSGITNAVLPFKYTDNLIGLNQYPSLLETYYFRDKDGTPELVFELHLQLSAFMPDTSYDEWQKKLTNSLNIYERIYWQIVQPEIKFTLRSSVNPNAEKDLPVSDVLEFVSGVYTFLESLRTLEPHEHTIANANMTLRAVASAYNITPQKLADYNLNTPDIFAAGQTIPRPYVVSTQDSLQRIHTQTGQEISTLADVLPLQVGAFLKIPGLNEEHEIKPGETFARIAKGVKPEITTDELAAENETTYGIFQSGTVLAGNRLDTTLTGDSLQSILERVNTPEPMSLDML
ncbi:MAG TPA: LysM peptidoglycan-binding domain-containing protein, partial [Aggregatilineales bacterium]|nr:LysM peptidoglycan-binding domain-containing protein [Aggregatilineales bacterium]